MSAPIITDYQSRMLLGALIFGGSGSMFHFAGSHPCGAERTQRVHDLVRIGLLERVEPTRRAGRQKDAFTITEKGKAFAEVLLELDDLQEKGGAA